LRSQPEYPLRRLAVFGGFNHPEPAPTWSRVTKRETPRLRPVEADETIVALDVRELPAVLYRAA
jgi:hypothetical protein